MVNATFFVSAPEKQLRCDMKSNLVSPVSLQLPWGRLAEHTSIQGDVVKVPKGTTAV